MSRYVANHEIAINNNIARNKHLVHNKIKDFCHE